MIALAIAILLALGAGALYQAVGSQRNARLYAPPGRIVEIDGHRLHLVCAGAGTPVVLFESGIAASSLSWTRVLRNVATFTRACAYDRAGLGWSDLSQTRLTVGRMLGDLHGVLWTASTHGPSILVGHSFGALLVYAYAAQHPRDVAGLVLLDPPTDWQNMTREQARLLWGGIQLSRIGALLARLGVVRACLALLTGGAPGVPRSFVKIFGPTTARTLERLVGEVRKLPPEVHPVVQEIWCQPKCFRAMAHHLAALEETTAAARGVTSLSDLPLVVISGGDQAAEVIASHRQLARISSRGRHIVARQSGHWIQLDEPGLVVGTIRELMTILPSHAA